MSARDQSFEAQLLAVLTCIRGLFVVEHMRAGPALSLYRASSGQHVRTCDSVNDAIQYLSVPPHEHAKRHRRA
jgi:hypothetical protein